MWPVARNHMKDKGVDLLTQKVEINVFAHAINGGVCIDAEGSTSLPGLYAAGEVAGGPPVSYTHLDVYKRQFLFETADEAHRVIDGTVGTLIAEKTEEQKIHTVGWMDVGFRNIFSTRPVTSLEDMKNLKIRTMENDLHIAAFNAMGAIATPMASGDVFTGLQQGTIDAAENAIANLIANRYYEITKNVTWTNHVFGYMGVFMSDKAWNQIPDDLREDFAEGVKAGEMCIRDSRSDWLWSVLTGVPVKQVK